MKRALRRAFSLLEVMVAIAILGLVLTVILSAQGGLAASNRASSNMGNAVSLGRCKMTEIEEKMLKFGYPEIDQIDQGLPCCDDEASETYTCDTRVEKIELPNFTGGNALGDGGALTGAFASPTASANPAGGATLDLSGDGGLQGLGSQLGSQFGAGGAGAEGLISTVMGILYPAIKPMYEASIRRVTVTVKWKEGPNARELPLIQYISNPQRGGFADQALMADGGAMDFGSGAPATGGGTTGASSGSSGAGSSAAGRGLGNAASSGGTR